MAEPRLPLAYDYEYEYQQSPKEFDSVTLEHDPRLVDEASLYLSPRKDPVFRAQQALHVGLTTVLTVSALDKFANILTTWPEYLGPVFHEAFATSPQNFMYGVGALEFALAIGLALKPKTFGYLFAVWLTAISVNLLIQGEHLDLVILNFGLLTGAYALSKLSLARDVEFFQSQADPLEEVV